MPEPAPYRERRSTALGATVWTRTSDGSPGWVLPDGCLDVIWDGRRLRVAGPDTVAEVVRSPAGTAFVALRFDPGVGPAVLGVPAGALRDQEVELGDVLPVGHVDRLAVALAEGAPLPDPVRDPARLLERWAADRLASGDGPDPAMRHGAELLAAGHRITAVADALGMGERQLHRRSLAAYGYGPKVLARILRFQRALRLARRGLPLARTAAEAGYSDQAHLAREARALGGRPLTALLASEG